MSGTSYIEAVTGFYARPLLAGDEVTLELSSEQSQVSASGIERTKLSTALRGRLGEWVAVGGAETSTAAQSSGTPLSTSSAQSGRRGVWPSVEAKERTSPR